jgi:hypothetical protein
VLKRTISWNASGFHWHTDPKHSERIVEQLGLTQGKPSDVPGSKSVGKTVTTRLEPLSEEDAASYASNAGSGLFHALDRPDLQFTVGRLMSHISCPNELDQLCLKLFGRYLIDKTECVWHYEYQPLPKCLTVLGDSDWATNEEHRRSVDCVHEYFGRHLWDTSSSTQDLVATSSGVAEFYAQVRGAALGIQNQNIMKQCDLNLEVQLGCDASAARGMMQKQGGGRVKHIDIKYLWIQQFIRDGKLKVFKVDTTLNTADLGTKFHPANTLKGLIAMIPISIGRGLGPATVAALVLATPADGMEVTATLDGMTLKATWLDVTSLVTAGVVLIALFFKYSGQILLGHSERSSAALPEAKAQDTRSIACQAPTTYKFDWKTPRFQPLPFGQHGAF